MHCARCHCCTCGKNIECNWQLVLWKCDEAFLPLIIIILYPYLKEKLFQNYQTIKIYFYAILCFAVTCGLSFQLNVCISQFAIVQPTSTFTSISIWIRNSIEIRTPKSYVQTNSPTQMNKSINHVTITLGNFSYHIESIDAAPNATNPQKNIRIHLNQLLSSFNWLSQKSVMFQVHGWRNFTIDKNGAALHEMHSQFLKNAYAIDNHHNRQWENVSQTKNGN